MTTMLEIKGTSYDLEDTFQRCELNILVYMTKRLGVTMRSIIEGLQSIDVKMQAAQRLRDSGDPTAPTDELVILDFLSDEDGIDAFRGLVWLARTYARERTPDGKFFTLDEASDGIGITDFRFITPEADQGPKDAGEATQS